MDLSDVFEVGNPWILGGYENLQEERVDQMLSFVSSNYGGCVSVGKFESLLSSFDIDYGNLPQFLKDRLDTIDVY